MRVLGGGLSIIYLTIGLTFFVVGFVLQVAPASSVIQYILPYTKQLNLLLVPANAQFDVFDYIDNLPQITGNIAVAFITVGALQALIGVLGVAALCSGRRRPVLTVFFVALVIMIILQMALIVLYYALRGLIVKEAKATLQRSIDQKYTGYNSTNMETILWNVFHVSLACCGINSGRDFDTAMNWPRTVNYSGKFYSAVARPLTCCKPANYTACLMTNHTDLAYTNYDHGCWSDIQNVADTHIVYAALSTGALILLEVMLVAFAASVCYTGRMKAKDASDTEELHL